MVIVIASLGAQQCYKVGSDYRSRYLESDSSHRILDISEDKHITSQVYASAPDQSSLKSSATAFLQGLYPPLIDLDAEVATSTLNNGSDSTSPLKGYQYVFLHVEKSNSLNTIWIKGDDGCPANAAACKSCGTSEEFLTRMDATKPENLTYKNADDIFDLINVACIHNRTWLARNVTDEELFQLRTLADSAEVESNFNASQPERAIHAQTLAAGILEQLSQTVA
ncbi:hypothetical protein C8035_v010233 [Colletotrichum spinosum]|uniref:Uncharacterized protein n=1 Tax=Colletotrichum spinosum TaxID=1347390 RepID=A0A4V3HSD7_9PEZI|nr:hypothetical protein C8035_v010233 [Colletotrichum spinosum]